MPAAAHDHSPSFVAHSLESAPARSRPVLAATSKQFGFVPDAMARLAASPAFVSAFGRLTAAFDSSSLDPAVREVVSFTVSHDSGCHVCLAIHTAMSLQHFGPGAMVDALRAGGGLPDARLEAVRRFTRAVLAHKGAAPDAEVAAFFAAGFTPEQAVDVVLGVGTLVMSSYANRLTRAQIDPQLAQFAPA